MFSYFEEDLENITTFFEHVNLKKYLFSVAVEQLIN